MKVTNHKEGFTICIYWSNIIGFINLKEKFFCMSCGTHTKTSSYKIYVRKP